MIDIPVCLCEGLPPPHRSRTKALLFRGRVPVESLDIENIEDGTGKRLGTLTNQLMLTLPNVSFS